MIFTSYFQITYEPEKATSDLMLMQVVASENTWVHQRRKRREQKRTVKTAEDEKTNSNPPGNLPAMSAENQSLSAQQFCESNKEETGGEDEPQTKKRRLDTQNDEQEGNQNSIGIESKSQDSNPEAANEQTSLSQTVDTTPSDDLSIEDIENYVVKATLTLRKSGNDIHLEMLWIDGQSKELIHQLMQLFKNKLK